MTPEHATRILHDLAFGAMQHTYMLCGDMLIADIGRPLHPNSAAKIQEIKDDAVELVRENGRDALEAILNRPPTEAEVLEVTKLLTYTSLPRPE